MQRWFKEYSAGQISVLAEPYRRDVWRRSGAPARTVIHQLQQCIAQFQPCYLLTPDAAYDDIWLRDIMPLWRTDVPQANGADWKGWQPGFDGWGGVQSAIRQDLELASNLFPGRVLQRRGWIAENGTFSHNGEWLLVGFASIRRRNPSLSESQLKSAIAEQFKPLKPIFIDSCLSADETAGHMDNMALFVTDNLVVYSATDDIAHPDFHACQQLLKLLQQLPKSITKVALPLPYPQSRTDAELDDIECSAHSLARTKALPLLCSYVNLIALNSVLIVPQYGLADDVVALQRLREALPDKEIVAFNARELVLGGGGLHCVSAQMPQALAPLVDAACRRP